MAGCGGASSLGSLREASKHVPLRLTEEERRLLALLEGALHVSEYTDRVDVPTRWNKAKIIYTELRDMLSMLCGLALIADPKNGRSRAEAAELSENADFFARVFEVGRRFKACNPDKMRSSYGKMMCILQDAQGCSKLGFSLVKDIELVYNFLEARGGVELLDDELAYTATAEVASNGKSRASIEKELERKRSARKALVAAYKSAQLSEEDITRALDSLCDANHYLSSNVGPVERMLGHLKTSFSRDKVEKHYSLKLKGGRVKKSSFGSGGFGSHTYGNYSFGGSGSYSAAKLSHDHPTQYTFVYQSLRLWSEAMASMYRLWLAADGDMLTGRASYRLLNTGQGLNRVQSCPTVASEMRKVLSKVQSECGAWVGLSVVHLGDRDVPNALVFIDKYAQIPRILTPIASVIENVDSMTSDPGFDDYVDNFFGSLRDLKMEVLTDYFTGGFDGDGDDGGSCIDGRLTSTWNWTAKIAKKNFYHVFMLSKTPSTLTQLNIHKPHLPIPSLNHIPCDPQTVSLGLMAGSSEK
ncbi:unnamed protein product [Chrysoparadoxa australica]